MEQPIVLAVVALAVGACLGWLAARARMSTTTARAAAQVGAVEQRLADADRAAQARIVALEDVWAQRLADTGEAAERRVAEAHEQFRQRLEDERAGAAEGLERERSAARQRLEELRADSKRLADQFDSLARQALAANSAAFLEQAEERLKRSQAEGAAELARREQAVAQLVEPLSRVLGEVKAEVSAAEQSRISAHSALAEQVRAMQESSEHLRSETGHLVTALRAPQVRGRWGEIQLRRIVEAAGMVEHVDFEEQESVSTDDGLLRPDLVVRLPGDKRVVVDSKVAFSAYLEAMEARDDTSRAKRLEAHARHLRTHIDQLGSKAYWEHVPGTPEFVVMFVPAEVFLNAALEQEPTLLEHAFARNVVVATPATLVALLRTVAYTWRQEMLAAEAQQVLTVGRELHKRLGVMGRHLETLGKRLNGAVEAYNGLNASLDRNVVTQARRFSALQGLEQALGAAPPLEILAVAAHKDDLYGKEELYGRDGRTKGETEDPGETGPLDARRGRTGSRGEAAADQADPVVAQLVADELGRAAASRRADAGLAAGSAS